MAGRKAVKIQISGEEIDVLLHLVLRIREELSGESGKEIARDIGIKYAIFVQSLNETISLLKRLDKNQAYPLFDEQSELFKLNELIHLMQEAVFQENKPESYYRKISPVLQLMKSLIAYFDRLLGEITSEENEFVVNINLLRSLLRKNLKAA